MSQLDALNSAELPQHSTSASFGLKQLLALFSTSVSSAQGQDTDYQIANFNYYLVCRKQNQLHVPFTPRRKKKKRVKTNQQNAEHCTGREIQPPSNKTVSAAFLPSCVCVSLFLRAIKFSILGIVSCFIDQAVRFARSCLERDTSF